MITRTQRLILAVKTIGNKKWGIGTLYSRAYRPPNLFINERHQPEISPASPSLTVK